MVAVGGIGGSGTRVVAEILIGAGVNMGFVLNSALDDLLFTSLFKNPQWLNSASKKEVVERIQVYSSLRSSPGIKIMEKLVCIKAIIKNGYLTSSKRYVIKKVIFGDKASANELWGWKEPNTYYILADFYRFNPKFKYIHVIRHGLDMAFSNNRHQLYNWGNKYGIIADKREAEEELIKKQLNYWIKSNKYAIAKGREVMKENFYLMNHTELCMQPLKCISELMHFLNIELSKKMLDKLCQIPSFPSTYQRYLNNDISIFTDEQLYEVEQLGFKISTK